MRLRSPRSLALPVALVGLSLASGCGITNGLGDEALQVYSARSYGAEEAYRTFTEDTGIEVEFLNGNDAELRERLSAEGEDSPADVYLTVDVANLSLAAEQDLLQPLESPALEEAVPARTWAVRRHGWSVLVPPQ